MKRNVLLGLLFTVLLASGGPAIGSGVEIYVYYYPDATYSGAHIGECAQNAGCAGTNYCAGDTTTNYRLWETNRCAFGHGGCHCEEKINGSWVVVTCPSTAAC